MKEFEDMDLDDMIAEIEQEMAEENQSEEKEKKKEEETEIENQKDEEKEKKKEEKDSEQPEYAKEQEKREQNEESIKVNLGGLDLEFNTKEELLSYVQNNQKQTEKTQEELFMEENGLSRDDLQLLADAKKGDPAAIKKLMGEKDFDEVDEAGEYNKNFQEIQVTELDRLANQIQNDETLQKDLSYSFQYLPKTFADKALSSAEVMKDLIFASQKGILKDSIPEAIKQAGINGQDVYDILPKILIEKYNEKYNNKKVERTTNTVGKKEIQKENNIRKQPKEEFDENDIWDMDEDEFNELLDNGLE